MVVAFYFRLHLAYFPRPVVAIFARPEQGAILCIQIELKGVMPIGCVAASVNKHQKL